MAREGGGLGSILPIAIIGGLGWWAYSSGLSTIPTWAWIAAAGVGAFVLFGGHKHG